LKKCHRKRELRQGLNRAFANRCESGQQSAASFGRDRCSALSHWSDPRRRRAARFFPCSDAESICGRKVIEVALDSDFVDERMSFVANSAEPNRKASMAYDLEHGRRARR